MVVLKQMKILEVCNLTKKFHDSIVLENINIQVEKPEIVGIVGGNASGKSVLFKCITGLLLSEQGCVKIMGHDIKKDNKYSQEIGALIEYPAFIPNYTGYRNLLLLSLFSKKNIKEDIKSCMIELGLNPDEKKPLKNYSLGMRQKLGIAAAVMEKPKLILLDEPTNNLDQESVIIIHDLIRKMKIENGSVVLMTSHNNDDIEILCDRIFELKNGHLKERKKKDDNQFAKT